MKKLAILFSVAFALNGLAQQEKQKLVFYGPEKVNPSEAVSTQELLKQFEEKGGMVDITFVGKISEVCSKAGCWINVDKGNGETFMVRFKDHFTIPTNTPVGTQAFLSGNAYKETVSVEMLRHFAEDAGKSKEEIEQITEPKVTMSFEADGIAFAVPSEKKAAKSKK